MIWGGFFFFTQKGKSWTMGLTTLEGKKKKKTNKQRWGITCLCSENVLKNSSVYYTQVVLHSLHTP